MTRTSTGPARAVLWMTLLAALTTAGCTVHARPAAVHVHAPRPAGRVVAIAPGHRHTAACGHYRFDKRWYHVTGHHHGRGCGHTLVRGVWVLRR